MDAMGMECNKNQPNNNNPCSPMTVKIISRNREKHFFVHMALRYPGRQQKQTKKQTVISQWNISPLPMPPP